MKHLTRDVKSLIRNRRLLTCYALIAVIQLGLGATAIHKAKQGELTADMAPQRVHVVKDVRLVQADMQDLLLHFHAEL